MAETREIREAKRNYSFPRDLLREFVCSGGNNFPIIQKEETPEEERPENVELSLGLSLNGRFGVEPKRLVANSYLLDNKKLIRASSVTNFLSFPAATDDSTPLSLYSPLTRTCSLPAETEEERMKRKELQSLRRSEAKRKRGEKLKNVRVVKGKTEDNWEINRRNSMNEIEVWGFELKAPSPPAPPQLPPLAPPRQFPSQGSIGSQGSGGSSGVSDFESQPFTELGKTTEIKSSVKQQFVSQQIERKPSVPKRPNDILRPVSDNPCAKSSRIAKDESLKTMLADMPCVSTREEGPNGKKIEGFLYRYKKGEDLRIVCVCHGSFLTPSEFVKHGGGGDVEHPLRHIVVSPSSFCQK